MRDAGVASRVSNASRYVTRGTAVLRRREKVVRCTQTLVKSSPEHIQAVAVRLHTECAVLYAMHAQKGIDTYRKQLPNSCRSCRSSHGASLPLR